MRLVILTQYYPPEIGAPQNRLHELAVRLQKNGVEVEVLTALPNYPRMEIMEEYRGRKNRKETIDGIPVTRAGIYVSKSKGIVSRLLNYFSFVWTSYWKGKSLKKADFLMVESPPLFLGYSAMALSRKLKAKLIFNVSDLWPESAEKMGIVSNRTMLKMAYRLEAKCYRKSSLITGQTNGIVQSIKERFPQSKVHWLPNGVDVNFYDPSKIAAGDFREAIGADANDVVFFYGGIIGYAQGLEIVLEAAEKVKQEQRIKIVLQGAGPVKDELLEIQKEKGLDNVIFRDPVPKSEMPSILKSVDVALVPLRKLDLFKGAIPSKIFEAQSMQLPLLLGVEGEAHVHFIENANAGFAYEPENAVDMAEKMLNFVADKEMRLQMGHNGRNYVSEHFNRNKIAKRFQEVLEKN
jgi:glycosyltransferase involved in cell wall biosynthesis